MTDKTLPSPIEIQLLEVLKKLTESGWIVGKAEIKQIIDFVGVGVKDVRHDPKLRDFLKYFLKQLSISESLEYFLNVSADQVFGTSD